MASTKPSRYGRERLTAYALWRGPDFVRIRADGDLSGGHCVLRLALRQGNSSHPQIEGRAAFASFHYEEQPDAIVRAMSWEKRLGVRTNRTDPLSETPFTIPAKFVRVPIALVRQWVKRFDGMQTTLQLTPQEDDSLPICSLRIEADYVYNAFEKVWQVIPGDSSEPLRAWLEVWHDMGMALQTQQALTDVEESFPCVEGRPEVYDLQAYEPWLTLSL